MNPRKIWYVPLLVLLLAILPFAQATPDYPTYTKELSATGRLPVVFTTKITLTNNTVSGLTMSFYYQPSLTGYITDITSGAGGTVKIDDATPSYPYYVEAGKSYKISVEYSSSVSSDTVEVTFNTLYNTTVKVVGKIDSEGETTTQASVVLKFTASASPITDGMSLTISSTDAGVDFGSITITEVSFTQTTTSISKSGGAVYFTVNGGSVDGTLTVAYSLALTLTDVDVYDYVKKETLTNFISSVYSYIAKGHSFGYLKKNENITEGAVVMSFKDGAVKSYSYSNWKFESTGICIVFSLFVEKSEFSPSLTGFTLSKQGEGVYIKSLTENVTVLQPNIILETVCEDPVEIRITGKTSGFIDAGIYALEVYINNRLVSTIPSTEKILSYPDTYEGFGYIDSSDVDTEDYLLNVTIRYTLAKQMLSYDHFKYILYIYGTPSVSEVSKLILSVTADRLVLVKTDKDPIAVEDVDGNPVEFGYGEGFVVFNGSGKTIYIKLPATLTVKVSYKGEPLTGATVEIYNTGGSLLFKKTTKNGVATFNVEPNLTYIVKVISGEDTQSKTVTIVDDTTLSFTVTSKPSLWDRLGLTLTEFLLLLLLIIIVVMGIVFLVKLRGGLRIEFKE